MSVHTLSERSEGEIFEQFREDAGYMAVVPVWNSFTPAYTTTLPLQYYHNNTTPTMPPQYYYDASAALLL
jgi:hypothetical protein